MTRVISALLGPASLLLVCEVAMKPGDVVWTPPGVKHWHAATATDGLTHIAIQEHAGGSVVTWMEPVTEEKYRNDQDAR
jgi:uncharacterized RmlC-like cupin family protein